jgi:NTP pyrophosphatase (non-canonical NTP hydrolase)
VSVPPARPGPGGTTTLDAATQRAREVRDLYEVLERRANGQVWTPEELMLGFSSDVGAVGRLVLAHSGTWDIDGDVAAELSHKLAESLWWVIVLADRLGIDISQAYDATMDRIQDGLSAAVGSQDLRP